MSRGGNGVPKGPNIQGAVESLLQRKLPGSRATMQDIELALTEAAAAVLAATEERDHWRANFGIVQTEMVMLASVLLKRLGKDGKLVVNADEFRRVAETHQLVTSNPEPGIRIYQLQEKPKGAERKAPKVVLNG